MNNKNKKMKMNNRGNGLKAGGRQDRRGEYIYIYIYIMYSISIYI